MLALEHQHFPEPPIYLKVHQISVLASEMNGMIPVRFFSDLQIYSLISAQIHSHNIDNRNNNNVFLFVVFGCISRILTFVLQASPNGWC